MIKNKIKNETLFDTQLLNILPASSSVSVTSPENLMRELFTHKGCGTLCRKETKVHRLDSMENIDVERLTALLKRSFKGRSPLPGYIEGLGENLYRIYITDDYEGAIILTKVDGISAPYMDKFAVSKLMQGTGTGKALWKQVVEDEPKLWWRSRKGNPVNNWYHEIASTLASNISDGWRLYSYGYDLHKNEHTEELRLCANAARIMAPTIMPPSDEDDNYIDDASGGSAFSSTRASLSPAYNCYTTGHNPLASQYSMPGHRFSSGSSSSTEKVYNAGLIGARGYVGAELIRLISDHPNMNLAVASSRALQGENIQKVVDQQKVYGGASSWACVPGGLDPDATFTNISPSDAAAMSDDVDVWFLALPNGKSECARKNLNSYITYNLLSTSAGQMLTCHPFSIELSVSIQRIYTRDVSAGLAAPFVESLIKYDAPYQVPVIVDLSADHRFLCGMPEVSGPNAGVTNPVGEEHCWTYGLPERYRHQLFDSSTSDKPSLVANPGCYATGAQIALLPLIGGGGFSLKDSSIPNVFGVSGYSGAGTTPSDKNNEEKLKDNLMAYGLVDHIHEREVSSQLGRPIFFMPHVAPHFRGISLTISVELERPCSDAGDLENHFREFYANDTLISVSAEAPQVSANAGGHHVCVGGFSVSANGKHAVIHATIDNLLKGAATQALQNANLCLGMDEMEGIHVPHEDRWALEGGLLTAKAHATAVTSQNR